MHIISETAVYVAIAVCIVGVVLLTALSITVSYWSKQMGGRR